MLISDFFQKNALKVAPIGRTLQRTF